MRQVKLFLAAILGIALMAACGKEEKSGGSSYEDLWGGNENKDETIYYVRTV